MIIQGTTSRRIEPSLLAHPGGLGDAPSLWPRLGAVVLLAGSVRPSKLRKASGRSGIELPIASNRTVLDAWLDQLSKLAGDHQLERLVVRVMVDRMTSLQPQARTAEPLVLSIEQDPSEFRGTGGLLHDLANGYEDDEFLLVGHASQLLFVPLAEQADAMVRSGADFSMVCCVDGSPAGLMLIRCGCLREINGIGFVDLNEQAMPQIATDHDVRVVRYDRPTTGSVRTRSGYIQTLCELHRMEAGMIRLDRGLEEDWRPTFGIIEAGSQVAERAIVHDSVVLNGARVEAGAVLVRSVACPGAVIGRGQEAIDTVVDGGFRGLGLSG